MSEQNKNHVPGFEENKNVAPRFEETKNDVPGFEEKINVSEVWDIYIENLQPLRDVHTKNLCRIMDFVLSQKDAYTSDVLINLYSYISYRFCLSEMVEMIHHHDLSVDDFLHCFAKDLKKHLHVNKFESA